MQWTKQGDQTQFSTEKKTPKKKNRFLNCQPVTPVDGSSLSIYQFYKKFCSSASKYLSLSKNRAEIIKIKRIDSYHQ